MNPAALILAYVSFWSIMAAGVYLVVVALGNLRGHRLLNQAPSPRGPFLLLRRLSRLWDILLLLLGGLLAASGMFFLYMVAYG